MISGVADTNCILLVAGGTTVIVTVLVSPVTIAVITSDPEAQLLSLYAEVAVPRIVVTGEVRVALVWPTQLEVKATEIGTVAGEPFTHTSALTLLVP
jgi:hypothetical protein